MKGRGASPADGQLKAQIPWLRVFVESVVIVASILMAFGLQAWWDGAQSRREMLQDLEQVLVELAEARQEISVANAWHDRMLGATESFQLRLSSTAPNQTLVVADTLVAGLLISVVADPPATAFRTLISSGGMDEIENEELIRGLLSWLPLLEDL